MHVRRAMTTALVLGLSACAAVLSIDDVAYDAGGARDGGSDIGDASVARADAPVDPPRDGSPGTGDANPPPDAAPPTTKGCADGTREAFADVTAYAHIAGCAGGWSEPGLLEDGGPSCRRGAGDTSNNPAGSSCHADDLCAAGWHVCTGAADVVRSGGTCNVFAGPQGDAGVFFATRQPGAGATKCGASGTDDLFGCGTMGSPADSTCTGLNATSGDGCSFLALPWICVKGTAERANVTKPAPGGGGVLCCAD
jgi:hypothetical protein